MHKRMSNFECLWLHTLCVHLIEENCVAKTLL